MSTAEALSYLFPGISFQYPGGECLLRDDGNGAYIEVWRRPEPQPTQEQIAFAMLPASKAQRIAQINAECRARLIARYGTTEEQVSRSLGIYGTADRDAMIAGIADTIDASNVASNAVLAATTIQDVEAVTVTWPAI